MEQLFGSKTRVKLLKLFMQNPNRAFYVREITRKVDEQINSVRRELANLLSTGILVSRSKDNRLYYEVRQDYEHYPALRALFAGVTIGDSAEAPVASTVDKGLAATLKNLGAVDALALMGAFTGDNKTGVDVLIVGNVNKTNVNNYIADLEDEESREIKYAVMTRSELDYRRSVHDRFMSLVEEARKTVLHDPDGLLSSNTKAEEVKAKPVSKAKKPVKKRKS